jgi:hypothetical protein
MTVNGTDAYGPYVDTGVATTPTPRPNVEEEQHLPAEIDTGTAGLSVAQLQARHVKHRATGSPR